MSQLKVNSIVPVGGLPSGSSGGIIQIRQTVKTDVSSAQVGSNTLSGSVGLDVNITPSSASSKILILVSASVSGSHSGETQGIVLLRGGSVITGASGDADGSRGLASSMAYLINSGGSVQTISMQYLDSPASTSQQTYSIQLKYFAGASSHTIYINRLKSDDNAHYRTRSASFVTAMEVTA
tara:strand:- start:267 stop:809 length:543 start_codon:yes stop_codon:yes gene_type:complete